MPVLACDAAVHSVKRVMRTGQLRLAGGGGTDMGAGIQTALELRPRPDVVVVITDGFTPWPEQAPKGARVVVGLLEQGAYGRDWPVPGWARAVGIPAAAALPAR